MSVTITSGPTPYSSGDRYGWSFGLSNGRTVYVLARDDYTRTILSEGRTRLQQAIDELDYDGINGGSTITFEPPQQQRPSLLTGQ